jgi:phage baseplate assembly protein W
MAIKINSVSKPTPVDTKYIYKDLHLDLTMSFTKNKEANKLSEVLDAKADYDVAAISNSILNLFTTIPGQKLLNPAYGLNLAQFLFSPISTLNAQMIGEAIKTGINRWEPRVRLDQIGIEKDEDQNQYTITLSLFIPIFKQSIKLSGILNNSGFYYV